MPASTLREAIDTGDVPGLAELLRQDPSLRTALVEASDIEPTSPLTYVGLARFYGYADHDRTGQLAQVLLEAGADRDDEAKNGSPLICAASHGDTDVVRVLLAAGARVDLKDAGQESALRMAAAFGYPEIVDLLLGAGAQPESVIEAAGAGDLSAYDIAELSDHQRACALRAAAVNEHLDVVDTLLDAGTPIDAEVDGHPAIYWAERQGRAASVRHLGREAHARRRAAAAYASYARFRVRPTAPTEVPLRPPWAVAGRREAAVPSDHHFG